MSDDRNALQVLQQASELEVLHEVLHYLYVPTQRAAADAALALRALDFSTEERLGADGVNWLVLATHTVAPSEAAISAARQTMERLAAEHSGEYDGWEARVPGPGLT